MRIIPKKIKTKNTVYKCYSMVDILVALSLFALIFALITKGQFVVSILMLLFTIILFIPTPDGIFYEYIIENIKFLLENKSYTSDSTKEKANVDSLIDLEEIDDSGVIHYKQGGYARVIKLGQKNFGIEDEYQQDIDIDYFANVLKLLDESVSIDLVKIDRAINLDDFATGLFDRVSLLSQMNMTKQEKDLKGEILKERIDEIDKLNNLSKKYLAFYYIVVYSKRQLDLEQSAINIVNEIAKAGLSANMLNKRECAMFLKYSISRDFDERELSSVKDEDLIDWIKPKKVTFKANKFEIDNLSGSLFTLQDYPLRVKNAWGAGLFNIPNTKIVMHIKPVEKSKAIRRIDKSISDMETKELLSEKASDTNSAEIHKETMETLLDSLQAENESLLDVTFTLTVYDYLNKEDYKKEAKKKMILNGFKASNLYGRQIDAFKASMIKPKDKEYLKNYVRGINSSTLAAVFPFVRTFVMDKDGILLGENKVNKYPFIFNLWKRGEKYQNSNAMVIGQSGSGKSFFLKNLLVNEWANNTRVIILDPENEYVSIIKRLNGNLIDVGNAKEGAINPFHIYKILSEDGENADSKVTFNTHLKMLESFFKIVLVGASNDVIELINNLVVKTYKAKGIDENTDCSNFKPEDFPIFTDLLETLIKAQKEEKDEFVLKDYKSAHLYLEKFVNGRYSDIWNRPSTLKVDASIIDFSFQSLFANKNNVVANAQMLLIFRFIEQEVINARQLNRNGNSIRTLIVTDEAHLFIDAKYPIALDFFYQMNKRIRKYGGSFIPATQNINDWNASEELRNKTSTIIKNSQYLFVFKLTAPDMQDVLDVYKAGDSFNEDEQRSIISATTGQAFFVGSSELRSSVQIKANDFVKEIFLGGEDG